VGQAQGFVGVGQRRALALDPLAGLLDAGLDFGDAFGLEVVDEVELRDGAVGDVR